jgi:hypothetical protein
MQHYLTYPGSRCQANLRGYCIACSSKQNPSTSRRWLTDRRTAALHTFGDNWTDRCLDVRMISNFSSIQNTLNRGKYKPTPHGSLLGRKAPLYAHVRTVGVNLNWLVVVISRNKTAAKWVLLIARKCHSYYQRMPHGGRGWGRGFRLIHDPYLHSSKTCLCSL